MSCLFVAIALQAAAPDPTLVSDPQGRETEAQAIGFAAALHRRMDADVDGFLTAQEEARFVVQRMNGLAIPGTDVAHPLPPVAAAIFAAADTDHDGRVSLAETLAEARREFALADGDHDGVVTPDERVAFLTRELAAGKLPDGVRLSGSSRPTP